MFLDLSNFRDHPTEKNFIVFFYTNQETALYFESLLILNNIIYDKDTDSNRMYYAISRKQFKLCQELNNQALNKFRKPFIPQKSLRYFVLVLFFLFILVAVIGYLKSA
jgi:hypothetical protein